MNYTEKGNIIAEPQPQRPRDNDIQELATEIHTLTSDEAEDMDTSGERSRKNQRSVILPYLVGRKEKSPYPKTSITSVATLSSRTVEGKGKPKNGEILQVIPFPFHELELVPWALERTPAPLKEDKGATQKV